MTDIASSEGDILAGARILIEEMFGVEPEEILPTASLVDDLGADSLDHVELVMAAEERWGIEISDEEAEACKTVQDMVDLVAKLTAAKTRVP